MKCKLTRAVNTLIQSVSVSMTIFGIFHFFGVLILNIWAFSCFRVCFLLWFFDHFDSLIMSTCLFVCTYVVLHVSVSWQNVSHCFWWFVTFFRGRQRPYVFRKSINFVPFFSCFWNLSKQLCCNFDRASTFNFSTQSLSPCWAVLDYLLTNS